MYAGRKLFLNKNRRLSSDYDYDLKNKQGLFRKAPIISRLYTAMIIVEYYFEIAFKIGIPYKLGYSIIADRYVYDTVINDISIDMELSAADSIDLLRKFFLFFPKPDVTFLVRVPEHVALSRKSDIPSLNYLKMRNKYYNEIALSQGLVILDGTLEISELETNVLDHIKQKTKE
jgi:dTMP kinase